MKDRTKREREKINIKSLSGERYPFNVIFDKLSIANASIIDAV